MAVAGGFDLVEEGVLPGRQRLHRALGGCGSMAPVPDVEAGTLVSGTFTSAARAGAEVGWSIAYPPGSAEGDRLPVCVAMHGRGRDHRWAFDQLSLQYVLADAVGRGDSPPFAIASVDGGDSTNWHRRADGDDPPAMVTGELLAMLAGRDLDTARVGLWGWSLGGFGALLLASTMGADRVAVVAASSPAVWATFAASQPGTFDDEADFTANDLFDRTTELEGIPLRIDCGTDDPFADEVRGFGRDSTPRLTAGFDPAATTRRSGPGRRPRSSSSSAATSRKPRLLVLNGPPAVGKSTLARRFAAEHPRALRLDVDELRDGDPHWRETPEESGLRARAVAVAMARGHLVRGSGRDRPALRGGRSPDRARGAGRECDADLCEIVLVADVEATMARFVERGARPSTTCGRRRGARRGAWAPCPDRAGAHPAAGCDGGRAGVGRSRRDLRAGPGRDPEPGLVGDARSRIGPAAPPTAVSIITNIGVVGTCSRTPEGGSPP